jgi:FkbM family methyltransferase
MLDPLKNVIRKLEARVTPRKTHIIFRGDALTFYRSAWWVSETQATFDAEILPYLACIEQPASELKYIVDAGAATGLFSIAAWRVYPAAAFMLFEPSARQRLLLARNLRLNGLDATRTRVCQTALWDREDTVAFRTIGAMSAIERTSALAGTLAFAERVTTISLDGWCERENPKSIDLIKMDIEGAEIEAIAGARRALSRFKPELLVMAYHERDGTRTFERCANALVDLGYRVTERAEAKGLLHASAR